MKLNIRNALRVLAPAMGVLVIAVPALAGGNAQARTAACSAGVKTIRGFQAQVFCGPAKATVVVNQRRVTVRNGMCERHPTYFLANIGTVVTGFGKKRPELPYFGLIMGRSPAYLEPVVNKPGTYHKGLITVNVPGLHVDLHDESDLTIVLGPGMRGGRFSATKPASAIYGTPKVTVTGSFTC